LEKEITRLRGELEDEDNTKRNSLRIAPLKKSGGNKKVRLFSDSWLKRKDLARERRCS